MNYIILKMLKTVLLFTLCLSVFIAQAQPYQLKEIPSYSCLKTTISNISYPNGDTTVYYAFFKKMDKLLNEGEGNITILHLGASHIQAGTFSHQIRSNLLGMSPNIIGNRGMLVPFSVAKTNNPTNYRTSYQGKWEVSKNTKPNQPYDLGLSGMTFATDDTKASIKIVMQNTEDLFFDFNKIYVLGHSESDWLIPFIEINDSISINGIFEPYRLAYRFDLKEKTDSFRLSFKINDDWWEKSPFLLRSFWVENQKPGITYTDIGVNGASVPSYLRNAYLENDLSFVKPDLCIFSIGINDASKSPFDTVEFEMNYHELIRRIRTVAPDCAILFTTNNDSFTRTGRSYRNNPNGLLAKQVFFTLGTYYNTGVWDLFTFMGGLGSMKKWESEGLAKLDKLHFTPLGYSLLGDLFYNALMTEYNKYLQAKEN